MTKVTLDDIEYDTENFTEEQTELLKEIQINGSAKGNINYQLYCVKAQGDRLAIELKHSLAKANANGAN